MTSDSPTHKARDVVLLVGLVFFVLTGFGTEIVSCESTSGCDVCGSHRRERTRHWGIWGAVGSNQTENSLQPSRFLRDFPEFQCSHQWSFEDKIEENVWDSPLVGLTHPHGVVGYSIMTCCGIRERPVWERYETDDAYRDSIQELLQTGATTR